MQFLRFCRRCCSSCFSFSSQQISSYFSHASTGRSKPYPPGVKMVGNPINTSSQSISDLTLEENAKEAVSDVVSTADLQVLIENAVVQHKTEGVIPGKGPPPEVPTGCCMSGCPTCVWVEYANEMARYYGDGGESAKQAIEAMEDQNMKAFLLMELKGLT